MKLHPLEGDHRLYCEATPASDHPPILLIHGFLSSKAQWRDNLEDLASFVRPVLVELPSHGRSPSPDDPSFYELASILQEFERIRTALGCETWFVCGHSLGGAMALNYALQYPQAVNAVAFTNSRSALEAKDGSLQQDAGPLLDAIRENGLAALETIPFHPQHMRNVSNALKSEIVEDAKLHDPDGLVKLMSGALINVSVRDEIGRINAPVLLVNGQKERAFQDVRRWLEVAQPDFDIVDLVAGHSPNAEVPIQFNSILRAFVASL